MNLIIEIWKGKKNRVKEGEMEEVGVEDVGGRGSGEGEAVEEEDSIDRTDRLIDRVNYFSIQIENHHRCPIGDE